MEANNMKAMREALESILNLAYEVKDANADGGCRTSIPTEFVIDTVKRALSVPPRNCDTGTAEAQSDRYEAFCDAYHKTTGTCDDCPIYKEECKMTGNIPHCQLVWAQLKKEG